ncbi:hypothetical protein [Mesobacillus sp.]|uniref:hypothetical protein n=2 Tax=Bacillota TaxID=1239 RepID=UPI0039EF7259
MYQEEKFYLIKELTIITGLNKDTIHHLDLPYTESRNHPETNRPFKILPCSDFERFLNSKKSWNFKIPEFQKYTNTKRPIVRQFFSTQEASDFMKLYGLELQPRTLHSKIKQKELPAYQFDRKYLVPIVYIIKLMGISLDKKLNDRLSKVINDDYEFKL